jgi:hypothetical protein
MTADTASIPAAVRAAVTARDDGRCRKCSKPAHHIHHRQPKGHGGTSNPGQAHGMAYLVSLCADCHNYVHMNPAESYLTGFLLHAGTDPEMMPLVARPGSRPVLLKADGTAEVSPQIALF